MNRSRFFATAILFLFLFSLSPQTPGYAGTQTLGNSLKMVLAAANEGKYSEATSGFSKVSRQVLEKGSPKLTWDNLSQNGQISKIGSGFLQESKSDIAKIQTKQLKNACQVFYIRHKQFPAKLEELINPKLPGGPILEAARAIIDPWGQPYRLQIGPLGTPVVISRGGGLKVISSAD